MKKASKLFLGLGIALTLIVLTACGHGYDKNGIPTELKKSYTGSTDIEDYDANIPSGGSTLIFNVKSHTIKVKTDDETKTVYFKVLSKKNMTRDTKGKLNKVKSKLERDKYFIMVLANSKSDLTQKIKSQSFPIFVSVSDSGKKIHMFEYNDGYTRSEYFDYSGESDT